MGIKNNPLETITKRENENENALTQFPIPKQRFQLRSSEALNLPSNANDPMKFSELIRFTFMHSTFLTSANEGSCSRCFCLENNNVQVFVVFVGSHMLLACFCCRFN